MSVKRARGYYYYDPNSSPEWKEILKTVLAIAVTALILSLIIF